MTERLNHFDTGLEHVQDFSTQNISRSCIRLQSGVWEEITDSLLGERYDHITFPSAEGLVLMGPASLQQGEVLRPDGSSSPSVTPVQEIEWVLLS